MITVNMVNEAAIVENIFATLIALIVETVANIPPAP